MKLSPRHALLLLLALSLKTTYHSYSKASVSTAFSMITATEIKPGSRVRVTIERGGIHINNYNATVLSWSKSGKLNLKDDNGLAKCVSPESCKLIKQ